MTYQRELERRLLASEARAADLEAKLLASDTRVLELEALLRAQSPGHGTPTP